MEELSERYFIWIDMRGEAGKDWWLMLFIRYVELCTHNLFDELFFVSTFHLQWKWPIATAISKEFDCVMKSVAFWSFVTNDSLSTVLVQCRDGFRCEKRQKKLKKIPLMLKCHVIFVWNRNQISVQNKWFNAGYHIIN